MATQHSKRLVVIVGETASGKSALAMKVAEEFGGEIIAADSRTVYKGMDIGTAKPSSNDQARVKHHLLDIIEPDEYFSVSDFKARALKAIDDIHKRGNVPIMVGGTGLYINSILFDYQFGVLPTTLLRRELNLLSTQELQQRVDSLNLTKEDVDYQNRRRLIRILENGGVVRNRQKIRPDTLILGLHLPKAELKRRIDQRIDHMLEAGFIDEVRYLNELYGQQTEAMTGIGYRVFSEFINGTITLDEAKKQFSRGDLLLAKRQYTWFKRNKYIQWFSNPNDAVDAVTTFLNTKQ